jgi:hypothetical protein
MELNGLANIVGNTGALHGIAAPPEREDFRSDEEYERAYDEWYVRTTFWHAQRIEPTR